MDHKGVWKYTSRQRKHDHVGDFWGCLHNQRLKEQGGTQNQVVEPEKPLCTTNQTLFLKRSCVW
jgi:hypothetical protein